MKKNKKNKKRFLGLLALLIFSFFISYLFIKRRSVYKFDSSKDYEYQFNSDQTLTVDVEIKNDTIILPEIIKKNQTVFLKLNLESTFVGDFFEPFIQISSKNYSDKQFFELGTKGFRYINLSSFIENNDTKKIFLKTKKISILDQNAQLIIFKNPDITSSKILIIAPHPDDAEIAAYGLYSKYSNSFIVTITAGDAGDYYRSDIDNDSIGNYMLKGKLRTWNSITVPLLGGISYDSILNLGYFDGTLKKMYKINPSEVTSTHIPNISIETFRKQNISNLKSCANGLANWESLVSNLECILVKISPDIIVTPFPIIDHHPDHKFTTIALIEAIKSLNYKKGKLFLYTNHCMDDYYPFGKMRSIVSLPPNFKNDFSLFKVYSNSLTKSMQKDKLFALEAMNDLRIGTKALKWDELLIESGLIVSRDILGKQKDYFRRSVRSNELFFTIPISEIFIKKNLNKITGNYN